MRKIPLYKNGEVVGHALVDDEDFTWLSQWAWHREKDGYVERYEERSTVGRRTIKMHNEIMKPGACNVVDHINRVVNDNRRANLRIATRYQNQLNTGMRRHNRTGIKGVHRTGNSWRAEIRHNKKVYRLGSYHTGYEAAVAYNRAAIKYHGEYAGLNDLQAIAAETEFTTYRPPYRQPGQSGVAGVTWVPATCRWRAQVWHEKRTVHLGYFRAIDDARRAVRAYKRKI